MRQYLCLTLLSVASLSAAQAADDRRPKAPPQVAIEACMGVAEGDSCQFTGRRDDTLSGHCRVMPVEQLACLPENHLRNRPDRAPRPREQPSG